MSKKVKFVQIVSVLLLIIGVLILLYPSVSKWRHILRERQTVAAYKNSVSVMEEAYTAEIFEAAYMYNALLSEIGSAAAISSPEILEGYSQILDITGTGIMGYICIERINVQLPIYHGTDAGILRIAAGHMEGTSLPVGGESTHSVIVAHRGLPGATLFTDLDQMEEGDIFTITVLDQVLSYEVDQILIVLPSEMEYLYIEDGEDYVTLLTCTPYGINSHRLLVRGRRMEE